jgi:hypothetical protein
MSVYVGIDVHRKRSQVAIIDQGGEVLAQPQCPERREAEFASRDVVYEVPDPDVTVCLSPARRRDARRPPRDPSKCEVRDEGERSGRC